MNEIIVDVIDSFVKHPILSVKLMLHAVRIQNSSVRKATHAALRGASGR